MENLTKNTFITREGMTDNDQGKKNEPLSYRDWAMGLAKVLGAVLLSALIIGLYISIPVFLIRIALTI